ncbi:metalloregulator ArsR/SmtB family transcription factor [Paenibacillus dokdonensis]|uniref:Metalloregulator ArsR/SmtB family transcription factor n=1 Tax=Paenibacillus dokdonensis TaxID=2567944 RepID=A0ABU6GI47_9BACL|nr:metalloregulator ArsR/SmtB family transcription factor [Paenibacillus dokdonensis]MEC0239054.1 metalloregulator ArsR/SmtB family transcription factor [Paenibacillus dokdonensis]
MEQKIQEMAEAYKLLADKTRLTIVALLKEQELCVCDIKDIIGMSQPNASQHLRKLKSAGLLNERKKGQWVYYSLNPAAEAYVQCIYEHLPSMKDKVACLNNNCCSPQEEA